jgi:hypothetical protein
MYLKMCAVPILPVLCSLGQVHDSGSLPVPRAHHVIPTLNVLHETDVPQDVCRLLELRAATHLHRLARRSVLAFTNRTSRPYLLPPVPRRPLNLEDEDTAFFRNVGSNKCATQRQFTDLTVHSFVVRRLIKFEHMYVTVKADPSGRAV